MTFLGSRLAWLFLLLALLGGVGLPRASLAQSADFVATVTAESSELRRNVNDSNAFDTVLRGTKLPAFGLSPDKRWVRVRAPDGTTVWIARTDVKVARASDEPAPPPSTPAPRPTARPAGPPGRSLAGERRLAHVVVEKTKVQLNATSSSPTLDVARKGMEFEVGGFSRDQLWVKVRTRDGRIGWVQKTDVRPGPAPAVVAKATPTPRPKPTGFDDPNEGFGDPLPPPPRRRRSSSASEMSIWADAGVVLINEKVTSREGYGYDLSAMGYGAGVRFDRRLAGQFFLEGGYLGTANQRIPAPESSVTVFSTLHRIDVSARYTHEFVDEDGPKISAIAGVQNYSFLIQPQSLSWFYSEIYNSLAFGLGGEYTFGGKLVVGADGRYMVPVLASQRYGSGSSGGDGQSNTSTGYAIGAGARYKFYSGGSLGLGYRGHFYTTQFTGEGKRGPNKVTGVRVADSFQAVTLTYARGF